MRLFGRDSECTTLDGLLAEGRSGRSAALVLRGEAGVGKTALLGYARRDAPDAHAISGVEGEADFPYAGLHRLLLPLLPRRDRLPARQRAALEVACGLTDGPPADLFLVSLAALTLLADERRLFVVDDAQWVDAESLRALAFVGRRLHAEGVVLLFGLRPRPGDPDHLAGLPVLDVAGLPAEAATRLLADVVGAPVDPELARRVAAATGGNPLALTDLARELTAAQLRGAAALPDPAPIGSRLEAHYSARIRDYPAETRAWALLAAADARRAATTLAGGGRGGVSAAAAGPAEADRLVAGSPPVEFRHPLVRSAVYGSAAPAERREVHAALAAVTDAPADADRRAWHLAAAATGPDESVAAELERGAGRAADRGGHAARAALLARAAELTGDPRRRAAPGPRGRGGAGGRCPGPGAAPAAGGGPRGPRRRRAGHGAGDPGERARHRGRAAGQPAGVRGLPGRRRGVRHRAPGAGPRRGAARHRARDHRRGPDAGHHRDRAGRRDRPARG
ncbi:ATP-binding protein [Asanoa iriomotensis]|uniref:ATP-binding protein n=1 Tax=Asanoa iriomotensis TaxID=234613 RepID=UPI0031D14354